MTFTDDKSRSGVYPDKSNMYFTTSGEVNTLSCIFPVGLVLLILCNKFVCYALQVPGEGSQEIVY